MSEAFREITQWKDNTPTGIYLLEGDKCFAFCNYKGEITTFKEPMRIDKRGRKFEKVQNLFNVEVEADPAVVEVAGSKGAVYYVNKELGTCTCQGYVFRSTCKHLQLAK